NANYNSAPADAPNQGPAHVSKLIWKFVPNSAARLATLTTGTANAIYNPPRASFASVKKDYEVLDTITPGRPVALQYNTSRAPFNDQRVRQAFSYSIDRNAIVKSAFYGSVEPDGNGGLTSGTYDYDPSLRNAYPRDLTKAAELLDAAGWRRGPDGIRVKDGKPLRLTFTYGKGTIISDEGEVVLQNIQSQAKEAGFDVVLTPLNQTDFFSGDYNTKDSYDLTAGYWIGSTPAELYVNWRQDLPQSPNASNSTFYNNPELDHLILAANQSADPAQRTKLYQQAQQLISQQAVAVGLYPLDAVVAVNRTLTGVRLAGRLGSPDFTDARLQ
ncbi:MAG: ABC transporter substrate-binding protein, partial [Gordonia sp. (in: high G+C Gram-positive bacteria)]